MKFEKICSASGLVPQSFPVDLRNLVIHGYDKVGNVIIWGIMSRDLPELQIEITKLLNKES